MSNPGSLVSSRRATVRVLTPGPGARLRPRSSRWARALALCLLAPSLPATAAGQSILLGFPPPPPSPVPVDPSLPTGAPRLVGPERPAAHEPPACSFRWPVCVHRGQGVAEFLVLRLLAAAERAMDTLVLALDLPAPAADGNGGGSPALDLYLTPGTPGLEVVTDAVRFDRFDSAGAYCLVGSAERFGFDRVATFCVAEAIGVRLDPAATPHVRRAYATHLWWATGSPTEDDLLAVSTVQASPERAIVGSGLGRDSEGSALLFEYLEARWAPTAPGELSTTVLALSGSHTSPGAWRWRNEPDLLDVLRATFEKLPMPFPELLGDFSVSRALIGQPGSALSLLRWAGELGTLRFDTTLPLSTLPRHVAFNRPVEPTGAVVVWVPFDEVAPRELTLGLRAEWEAPVSFQWIAVRIQPDGTEQSRVTVPFQERGTSVEQRVVSLEGLSGLLVVGTNVGGVDLAHPFDPDVAPYEPAGGTLYVGRF